MGAILQALRNFKSKHHLGSSCGTIKWKHKCMVPCASWSQTAAGLPYQLAEIALSPPSRIRCEGSSGSMQWYRDDTTPCDEDFGTLFVMIPRFTTRSMRSSSLTHIIIVFCAHRACILYRPMHFLHNFEEDSARQDAAHVLRLVPKRPSSGSHICTLRQHQVCFYVNPCADNSQHPATPADDCGDSVPQH